MALLLQGLILDSAMVVAIVQGSCMMRKLPEDMACIMDMATMVMEVMWPMEAAMVFMVDMVMDLGLVGP